MARRLVLVGALSLLGTLACNSGSEVTGTAGVGAAQSLTKIAGDGQTVVVGRALTTLPAVRIADGAGVGVTGITVTFRVLSGGGTITGETQTTDALGVATVGGWTLGNQPGPNTLTVTTSAGALEGSPATFVVIATVGAPATVTKVAGDAQSAHAGTAVATAPAVRVTDALGNVVPNASVTFTASSGGTVVGGTATTGADGVATVGSWTLSPTAGANTLVATVGGATGPSATFSATGT
jgi:adhesin/invasin